MGFTPDLVASVWVGYDNHVVRMRLKNGRGESGSSIALPIWNGFMRRVFADADRSMAPVFPGPETDEIEEVIICRVTGQLANAACAEHSRSEIFWKGTAPTTVCELHTDSIGFAADTTLGEFTDFDRNFGQRGN